MTTCLFVSDLHGRIPRYRRLFEILRSGPPAALFLGGDLLPHGLDSRHSSGGAPSDFLSGFLIAGFAGLKTALGEAYPQVFVILGNDDGKWPEPVMLDAAARGLWRYIPNHRAEWRDFAVFGYGYVPPTPFQLKDWDRYDVSRYADPGCVTPEEGRYSVPVPETVKRFATIQKDLEQLAGGESLEDSIFLFHTPPYRTNLDLLAGGPRMIDHAPLDPHAGSIAVRRFMETRQPRITLHGHIHESPRLTGSWRDRIGRTHAFSAAHDGPELALVRFFPEDPEHATRELLEV